MKHDHNCLWTVFTRNLIFEKGSKTENMMAKDPIWIFLYNKIMKMEPKRLQDLSMLKVRD